VSTTTSELPWVFDERPSPSDENTRGGDLGLVTLSDSCDVTGHPASLYMQFFRGCSADKLCARKKEFRVDSVPKGCCVLTATNGDGRGTDEVQSYQVFLNGKRVLPRSARQAQVEVKLQQNNTLQVVLQGEPFSKVFILIAHDSRQSK
jgi:hypothetical protein